MACVACISEFLSDSGEERQRIRRHLYRSLEPLAAASTKSSPRGGCEKRDRRIPERKIAFARRPSRPEAARPARQLPFGARPTAAMRTPLHVRPLQPWSRDPLDPTGQSFYGGAACGVLHAINLGRQIVTMNNGLPPNMQINALGITPAGNALYAGATNGGVYQFTLAAQIADAIGVRGRQRRIEPDRRRRVRRRACGPRQRICRRRTLPALRRSSYRWRPESARSAGARVA